MSGVEIISSISTCVELLELVGSKLDFYICNIVCVYHFLGTAKYIIEFTEAARDYNNSKSWIGQRRNH